MTGTQGAPWLWAIPFLLTFISGVFADAYESAQPRMAMAAGGVLVLLQAACSVASLAGIL